MLQRALLAVAVGGGFFAASTALRPERRPGDDDVVIITRSDPNWKEKALAALSERHGFCILKHAVPVDIINRLVQETAPARKDRQPSGVFGHCDALLKGLRDADIIPRDKSEGAHSKRRSEREGTLPGQVCGAFRHGSFGRFHFMPKPSTELFQALRVGVLSEKHASCNEPGAEVQNEINSGDVQWQWWLPIVERFILESDVAQELNTTSPEDIYLSEAQLVVAVPGERSAPQPWHADNAKGGITVIAPIVPMCNAIGPTQLLPNSMGVSSNINFRLMAFLDPFITMAVRFNQWMTRIAPKFAASSVFWATEPLIMPGDAILMDARMLHRGLPNRSHLSHDSCAACESLKDRESVDLDGAISSADLSDPRPGRLRPIMVLRYDLKMARAPGR